MPIAALPEYLGKLDLSSASPGMRFGLFLPIWTDRADQERQVNDRKGKKSREADEVRELLASRGMDETIRVLCQRDRNPLPGLWAKNKTAANQSWRAIGTLCVADKRRMQALSDRQAACAAVLSSAEQLFIIDAKAIAPFTTGLGNEHPLENGFAFLWPYGLPYLPGSGVKGVLRQAARELAGISKQAQWEMDSDWTEDAITALFGSENSNDARRGALAFWDVIPQIEGNSLMVEVMTAHQSHYYQQGDTPHESGQPNPINFLTVPPGSTFTFHVLCNLQFLSRIAPELIEGDRWKVLLQQAFEHAFDWLGFGGKTAVGYGAMLSAAQREAHEREAAERKDREREEQKRKEAARRQAKAQAWPGARIKFNSKNGSLSVEKNGKTASAGKPEAEELLKTLPAEVVKKVMAHQFVRVTAYVSGYELVRVEVE